MKIKRYVKMRLNWLIKATCMLFPLPISTHAKSCHLDICITALSQSLEQLQMEYLFNACLCSFSLMSRDYGVSITFSFKNNHVFINH